MIFFGDAPLRRQYLAFIIFNFKGALKLAMTEPIRK